ncbi:MAG: cation-translocating P-type ATPase, partial [Bacteroidota bacterium]
SLAEMWMPDGPEAGRSTDELLLIARLACEPDAFDPMEQAIEEAFLKSKPCDFSALKLIRGYPLSGKYPIMTHIYDSAERDWIVASKGSPEGIILQSDLTLEQRESVEHEIAILTTKGFRLLAVADSTLSKVQELPADQSSIRFRFLGLLAFADPVKQNIPEVISELRKAGIRIKMITGDHPSTACHVAAIAGLERPNDFLTGEQLHSLSDHDLADAVERVDVFARSMPETKLKIIRALKARGEVVAMTGDGVNDAPALKAADIGVAMGKRGSEVARQASSLVLLDDDLSAMSDAISHGRRIYSNLKKSIEYIISIHIPLVSVVLVPLLLGWDYVALFSPVHVIFLEMVMGPTCSIVFEGEPAEPDVMRRPPRPISSTFFSIHELWTAIMRGIVVAVFLLSMIAFAHFMKMDEAHIRTSVFIMIVWSNIFLTFSARSERFPAWSTFFWQNPFLWLMHVITLIMMFACISWNPMMEIFGFSTVSISWFFALIGLSGLSVFWWEPLKRFKPN